MRAAVPQPQLLQSTGDIICLGDSLRSIHKLVAASANMFDESLHHITKLGDTHAHFLRSHFPPPSPTIGLQLNIDVNIKYIFILRYTFFL